MMNTKENENLIQEPMLNLGVGEENLDVDRLNKVKLESKGAKYVTSKIIPLSAIYFGNDPNSATRNAARKDGVDETHVQRLKDSFRQNGCDYNQPAMIVEKMSEVVHDPHNQYTHSLVCGRHRIQSLMELGVEYWIFDVYEFGSVGISRTNAVRSIQLKENTTHPPSKPSVVADIVQTACLLIQDGDLSNEKNDIMEWIADICGSIQASRRTEALKTIMELSDTYVETITYNYNNVRTYINNKDNYKKDVAKYTYGYKYDVDRDEVGAGINGSYIEKNIYKAISNFGNNGGKPTYFTVHVPAPGVNETVGGLRRRVVKEMTRIENNIRKINEYDKDNGRFPWRIESFFPQERKSEESGFIEVKVALGNNG